MIGRTILHYKIIEEIGRGGMGIVYKAEDTRLRRTVALKFLPRDLAESTTEVARFTQEAQAAATINHPNVCTIFAVHEYELPSRSEAPADKQHFIEMEYVDGSTLKQLSPVADLRSVVRYAVQIADGLREAHRLGIVHRDVKSENIMLNTAGQIKVMDFGLAKLKGSLRLTRTASAPGTTAYMSPEQIQGGEADYRSDQFALGIVLYELLTGRLPFRGEHEAAMMYSIVNEEPAPPGSLRPDVPDTLATIISRLLTKDRAGRYERTDELVSDLKLAERVIAGSAATHSSSVKVIPAGRRRKSLLIAAFAAVALIAAAAIIWLKWGSAGGEHIDSIAVLPFRNASGDPNTEYLSDGLTEHIINSLSQLRKFRVIPRSTSFHYKGKEEDARAIGEELGVRSVLSGRVIQRGDDLNIQAELIDVREQSQLWGEQYVRKISDLLTVQDEIERAIAGQLHLTGDETQAITKHSTENTDAYQLYLRGRYYWDKRSVAGFGKALQYFQQALDLDPNFALAYTGVADCYDLLGLGIYSGLPPREAFPKAKYALDRALQLDSTIGEPYTTRGHMNNSYEWEWPRAERDFRKGIDLSPKYATGHVFYALFLAGVGRRSEAREQFIRAQELEPLSLPINTWLGIDYYWDGEYDKSIEQIKKAIDIDPNFPNAHYFIAWPYLSKGMVHTAVEELRLGMALSANNPVMTGALVYALSRDGQHAQARGLLDTLLTLAKERYISAHNFAIAYLGVGDTANFYKSLEETVAEHAFIITPGVLKIDPLFDFARKDSRFAALLKKTGLPE